MDHIIQIQAIKRYKKHQLLHKNNNLFLYTFATLTCSLLCSTPIWYPSLCSSVNAFLHVTLPKIFSIFLSSKFLFIIGNLIVLVLLGESRIFSSSKSSSCSSSSSSSSPVVVTDVCYDEKSPSACNFYGGQGNNEGKFEKSFDEKVVLLDTYREGQDMGEVDEEEEEGRVSLAAKELNRRADDLIARVNKQRRLEAKLL